MFFKNQDHDKMIPVLINNFAGSNNFFPFAKNFSKECYLNNILS